MVRDSTNGATCPTSARRPNRGSPWTWPVVTAFLLLLSGCGGVGNEPTPTTTNSQYVARAQSLGAVTIHANQGGSSWTDESGNGFHGATIGGPRWSPTGGPGEDLTGYYRFDGQSQRIEVGDHTKLRVQEHALIWWERDGTVQHDDYATVISKGDHSYHVRAGTASAGASNRVAVLRGAIETGITGVGVVPDGWRMFMQRWTGETHELWTIDERGEAVRIGSRARTAEIDHFDVALAYGAQEHDEQGWRRCWRGDLAGVLLFDHTLSVDDMQALHAAARPSESAPTPDPADPPPADPPPTEPPPTEPPPEEPPPEEPPPADPPPADPPPDEPQPEKRDLGASAAVLWGPVVSWSVPASEARGNPFDVLAKMTFTHTDSGERRVTEAFYAGDGVWTWRFAPSREGTWTFATTSDTAQLHGWHGTVNVAPNPNPTARGFLTTHEGRFAQPTTDGHLRGRLYHVFLDANRVSHLHDFPLDPEARSRAIDTLLERVSAHGMDALFLSISHGWFEYGALSYRDHDSEDPSLVSFEVLDSVITAANDRGIHVHLWAWGDEERRRTPIGVGGINGPADRRLQRYIAARLGPLPGWTMSYAFDLEEWVTPEQVRSWATYLHERFAWPHLLMARETHADATEVFSLRSDKLDVFSNDERPTRNFFTSARSLLAGGHAVLYERRFLHTRDNVWDMTTTRRALWQFTLAGGAGAIWGPIWGGPDYPNPEQLRTHQTFWRERFDLDLTRASRVTDPVTSYVLRDAAGTRAVHYAENTDRVPLDLRGMSGPLRAVAVDATRSYREIDLGTLDPTNHTWTAPYRSDWAIAIGGN